MSNHDLNEQPPVVASRPANTVQRLAHTQEEAAKALGVSRAWFRQTILPELRVVRRGRRTIIPVAEVARWLDEHAEPL